MNYEDAIYFVSLPLTCLWNIPLTSRWAVVGEAWLYLCRVSFASWQSDICLTVLHHKARAHEGYSPRPPYRVITTVVWLWFKQPDPPICQLSKNVASEVIEPGFVKFILYRVYEYCSCNFLLRPAVFERDMAIMRGFFMLKCMTIHLRCTEKHFSHCELRKRAFSLNHWYL